MAVPLLHWHPLIEALPYAPIVLVMLLLCVSLVVWARTRGGCAPRTTLMCLAFLCAVTPGVIVEFDQTVIDHTAYWRLILVCGAIVPILLVEYVHSVTRAASASRLSRSGWVAMGFTSLSSIWILCMPSLPGVAVPERPWWLSLLIFFGVAEVVAATLAIHSTIRVFARSESPAAVLRGRIIAVSILTFGAAYLAWAIAPYPITVALCNVILMFAVTMVVLVALFPSMIVGIFRTSSRAARVRAIRRLVGSVDPEQDIDAILVDIARATGVDGMAFVDARGKLVAAVNAQVPCGRGAGATVEIMEHGRSGHVYAWYAAIAPPLRQTDRHCLRLYCDLVIMALTRGRAATMQRKAAQTLQEANQQLAETNRLKDQFLATASHELRTPVTAIAGFASTMCERWDDLEEDDRQHFIGIIRVHADRLAILVQDMLVTTRIEQRPDARAAKSSSCTSHMLRSAAQYSQPHLHEVVQLAAMTAGAARREPASPHAGISRDGALLRR